MNKRNNEKRIFAPAEFAVMKIQNSDEYFGKLTSGYLDCKQGKHR